MFRLSQFMRELITPTPAKPYRDLPGPVVIWNLVRRCNLNCKHCYSISTDTDFADELSTAEIFATMDQLKAARVPALILSGGEPLLRPDLFEIAAHAKHLGFSVSLSTNGTLIDRATADRIADARFDYVGISIDGIGDAHDRFRRKAGAFEASLAGIRYLGMVGVRVGLRFTMTSENADHLPGVLALMDSEDATKFYFSHLNYAGRGNRNRDGDAADALTRGAMDHLLGHAWAAARTGSDLDVVTGNNDADGAYFLGWVQRNHPDQADHIEAKLRQWGGNASGVNVANIDNRGEVHADSMWWHRPLGNVRQRPFAEIWADTSDPLMAGLKLRPRPVEGRCATCRHLPYCNGNTRTRAERTTGNLWAEDPGCYLTDAEISR
jgi:Fe-coproporphyrin III synthase